MTTFTSYLDVLPDPNYPIGDAGQSLATSSGGTAGPGFASVSLTSDQPRIKDSTNSGRILTRYVAAHKWKIKITYNPMTREQFDPVYTFLLQRNALRNNYFYISLPQNRVPKDSTFATWSASNVLKTVSSETVGTRLMTIQGDSTLGNANYYNSTTHNTPLPGDMFTFNAANSNHKKAYMVTRVGTSSTYNTNENTPADTHQLVIHCMPTLQKSLSAADTLVFTNPLLKVMMSGDIQEYSLNTQNLYSFSLNLIEVQ